MANLSIRFAMFRSIPEPALARKMRSLGYSGKMPNPHGQGDWEKNSLSRPANFAKFYPTRLPVLFWRLLEDADLRVSVRKMR